MPEPVRLSATSSGTSPHASPSAFLHQVATAARLRSKRFPAIPVWPGQFLQVTLLLALAGLGYTLLVTGLSLILGLTLNPTHPFLVGGFVLLLTWLFNPLRVRIEGSINRAFTRSRPVYTARLDSFRKELSQVADAASVTNAVRRYIVDDLSPTRLHIFLKDPIHGQYTVVVDEGGFPTSDLRFQANSPLVETLSQCVALNLEQLAKLPPSLLPDQSRLAVLGSVLYVPFSGQQHLLGWVALGKRQAGQAYTVEELQYLVTLCEQASVEIERAWVLADLRRRIQALDVLTRVAQGANSTLALNDILELLYAQTNQVIPFSDYRVMLLSQDKCVCIPVFWLEKDERQADREGRPVAVSQFLEAEIFHSQHSLVTGDYERECRARGRRPQTPGIYAWMGVPLNAGADTIGVISLGSRDPAALFSQEQCALLHAIANQAAGAIVKTRLLLEMEQHARQLSTLNEMGRDLTSTLDLKILLEQILNHATEILNCAAGALLLVDESSGDLVFKAIRGPAAVHGLGKRLHAGTGLAGEAALTKQAVLENEVKRYPQRFNNLELETGVDTQAVLAVPMLLKDRVMGVVEVINKASGLPFTPADEKLLTTFASQATIAIENARLYTLTDQALSDRVEELSVMQNIDRELNASLEIDRTLQITLQWAMRLSAATAGMVGILENCCISVKASRGYPVAPAGMDDLGNCSPGIQKALKSGQPQLANFKDGHSEPGHGLLPGVVRQLVFPICREGKVIALVLLESDREVACTEESLALIARFSDHAAIAISNAQLYAQVQETNQAKSKFVSFVGHELKNPMASIKGYTELVAGGMAGPVNSTQASFLATVRSNVDRMNTIVSDLNDLTKIQVGSLRLEFKAVPVKDLLEEVIRAMQRLIDEKGIRLCVNIPDTLPLVWADPVRLSQVLTNLLSNALKYTQEGGEITIGGEHCRSGVSQTSGLEMVHLWVKDTGIGIPTEDQGKIFQPYFRTDISKEMASGTGLGLNLTKSLVEMLAGRIWFESEPGAGTAFHFTVPVIEGA